MPISTNSILLVLTNPLPGHEEEFNRWYSDVHLTEVVEQPGFVSGRRFRFEGGQIEVEGFGHVEHGFLAVYEIDESAVHPDEALAYISAELMSGRMAVTQAIAPGTTTGAFRAITDTVERDAGSIAANAAAQ